MLDWRRGEMNWSKETFLFPLDHLCKACMHKSSLYNYFEREKGSDRRFTVERTVNPRGPRVSNRISKVGNLAKIRDTSCEKGPVVLEIGLSPGFCSNNSNSAFSWSTSGTKDSSERLISSRTLGEIYLNAFQYSDGTSSIFLAFRISVGSNQDKSQFSIRYSDKIKKESVLQLHQVYKQRDSFQFHIYGKSGTFYGPPSHV